MNKLINYLPALLFLSLNIVSYPATDGQLINEHANQQINNTADESVDWINKSRFPWVLPIFQLANSSIPSRRYNRTFKCTGVLVKPNAVLTSSRCIKDDESYVVATNMVRVSAGRYEILPYVGHHRLYPAVHNTPYELASITSEIKNITSVEKKIIAGVVILFFDTAIRSVSSAALDQSPKRYEIYSKKIDRMCVRVSMIKDSNNKISSKKFPEKLSSYSEFVDAYSRFENNSIDKNISDITFNDFVSVIATLKNETSNSEALLGSPLVCRGKDDVPVITGLLINTSYDGLKMYAIVGDMEQWINSKLREFRSRTEHLPNSQYDIQEIMYQYDLY
ncbi:uncharacterized protein LOC103569532 [Microplitis demolitor]|uniref:uncharacterized protein LOC103569532 n=1 Tax=Microplitis demolitor TaxID=69319 RepID=UPI0004CD8A60|nr:uncharacterized protein LOC103569532 [Microplitis demolitor]